MSLPVSGKTTFTVTIGRDGHDWTVEVTDADGGEYAKTYAPSVHHALRMAVPYMASVTAGPFAGALKALMEAGQVEESDAPSIFPGSPFGL